MKCQDESIFLKREPRSDSYVPKLKSKTLGDLLLPHWYLGDSNLLGCNACPLVLTCKGQQCLHLHNEAVQKKPLIRNLVCSVSLRMCSERAHALKIYSVFHNFCPTLCGKCDNCYPKVSCSPHRNSPVSVPFEITVK